MKIQIGFNSNDKMNQELINEIREISLKHGEVNERIWGARMGAIDIVSILEIVGVFAGLKILDGFVEGLVGKDVFVELGSKCRTGALNLADKMRFYLLEIFQNIINENKNNKGAITLIEYVNDFTIYTVLNHKSMSQKLINALPETIGLAIIITANIDYNDGSPRIIQLYPNFKTEAWDYILMPTNQAYGNYIDRYFDIRDKSIKYLSSSKEFNKVFNPEEADEFKFLINGSRINNCSKLRQ